MLSDRSAATVRATLPAVGAAIENITARFYDGLFAAHPELLRDLFNRGNQAAGTQRRALAGSIAAFAAHLVDRPDERPDAMLARIAHKHASLGIAPAQYETVHRHLFAAIAEVLGDAVTPAVAAAWDEVYWLMANALVAIEARLYAERGITAGPDALRAWEVVERIEETADVATFRLRPADGTPPPAFRAGQYVSVQVELADGARQIRQYSLSGLPGADLRQISVKRVRGGAGPDGEVSAHLHAHARVGDLLRVSAPYGDLVLDERVLDDRTPAPLLLASAGIGVTPMVAMLEQLAATGHRGPVTVVHADRSPADHALRAEHRAYAAALPDADVHFWYERPEPGHPADRTGRVDLAALPVAPGTHAYLCGPLPFMKGVRAQLLAQGVAPAAVHYEVFGPDLWLASPSSSGPVGEATMSSTVTGSRAA
ncbi:globin domain-containing protein [Streptomyces spectabilis]|uniref:nitric oxide dioxygenase n=1 Tax=Streptomyces spectabilis TaxID=68270 RepID=A0A5P2X783_STRST|nr:globin domain-containing protein [Streptomyces spectabilis]MBB5102977.1 nitric oxide dioxygenase [Streptomyces spectabilis]MCI3902172.1 FAD-binding oxidoreductase [Streptomyces spectabilis]QEV59554.1 hemin transporter [Streptomyces spectabilis]GGV15535.1 hemin transporter [Streptomyces spectabilis]